MCYQNYLVISTDSESFKSDLDHLAAIKIR